MVQKTDDFEAAFAQFSAPDDKSKSEPSADAAQADTGEGAGADTMGGDDAGSKNDTGAGTGNGDATSDVGDTGSAADTEGGDKGKEGDEAAAASATESGEGEDGKEKGKVDEGAAKSSAETPAAGPSADDILTGLKDLIAQGKKPDAEEGAAKQQSQEEEKPLYTEDETEFLKEYDKEWTDVARGEGLKRRQEYRELLNYVFTQVAEYVKPIKEMAEAVAERTHRQDIETNIADYSDNLREDVVKWVKEQPAYLQPAYNHVITNGTVEEVKDLVDRYRSATGKKPAEAGTQKPTGKKDNELSDEAKKAAESLAPVDVKRSGVQQPGDPSNFDDAWKQFADQT